jgi:hypothetical protein
MLYSRSMIYGMVRRFLCFVKGGKGLYKTGKWVKVIISPPGIHHGTIKHIIRPRVYSPGAK